MLFHHRPGHEPPEEVAEAIRIVYYGILLLLAIALLLGGTLLLF